MIDMLMITDICGEGLNYEQSDNGSDDRFLSIRLKGWDWKEACSTRTGAEITIPEKSGSSRSGADCANKERTVHF
jgi:hypothetical protein